MDMIVTKRVCKLCRGTNTFTRFRIAREEGDFDLLECNDCRFRFIGYLDEPMIVTSDEQRDRHISSGLESNTDRTAETAAMIPDGAAVLDVGCGGGAFLLAVKDRCSRAVGVEPSPAFAELSRSRGLEVRGEPLESPFWDAEAGQFDVVTLWDVIEHVNDPVATIERARQLLRPGGMLLMDTPSRDGFFYRFGEMTMRLSGRATTMGVQYSPTPFAHKQIFRKCDMRRLLDGFCDVRITEKFELSFPTAYYVNALVRPPAIRPVATAAANVALRLLPIRNKMIVEARA